MDSVATHFHGYCRSFFYHVSRTNAFSKSINKSNSNILRKVSQKWIQAVLQARTYGVTNSLINLLLLALRRYTFSRTRSKSEGEEY